MVNFKVVAVELFAILVAALMLNLPLAGATDINIYFNGAKRATAEYQTDDLINKKIDFIHEANDILWKNVKVAVTLNSASLAKEIKKIYLYKCKKLSPVNCIQSEPQVFENFIDVELLWNDISEREGNSPYPQVGSLLVMVKLEDLDGTVSWIGMWSLIRRTGYNTFTEYGHDISEVELHAKSSDMINPIKIYVENYGMIPFNWLSKAVFKNSNSLYALGAGENDLETAPPSFLTASPRTSEITTINKDFYFIFPNTSSGVANPLTLNLNPTFVCGDGRCESNLGETPGSCCIDCPCGSGQYCDVIPANMTSGQCKNLNQISLQVVSASSPQITDCSGTFGVNVSLRVNNPPRSLPSQISSIFRLNETVYSTTCYGGPPAYTCLITLSSAVECGQGSYSVGPNQASASITFRDGTNDVSRTLNASFSPVIVRYACSCESGFYCDTGEQTCKSEDAITLGITSLTSYLDNYNEGDTIDLTAKIFNPPTGLTVISTSATLNLTGGQVSPGSPTCTGPSADYEYDCSIPFQISGYSRSKSYTFDPNKLIFTITFKDGTVDKTKVLQTGFGPVSIPSQYCGDGVCNMGETQGSCCIDCDCSMTEDYCDKVRGCESRTGVTVSVESVSPTEFKDCDVPHILNITLRVSNPPSTLTLDYFYHVKDSLPSGWNLQCSSSGYGGIFNCKLTIPAIDGCTLPYYEIRNNELNISISFDDGASTSPFYSRVTRQLRVPFSNIKVIPIYHCGDGECETSFGESSDNCCIDCACPAGEYCDVTPSNANGTCRSKDAIKLIIDSPKQTVTFTSCEISHEVVINAHIQNQPTNTQPEQYYASLNGTPAKMVHCDAVKPLGGGDVSFNCTMTVTPEFKCEVGKTYTYRSNSFSVFISYLNGDVTETKTLSEKLPDVQVTQTIRSIYNIMQDAQKKMNEQLKRTQETAKSMFDAYTNCTKWVTTLAIIAIVASLASMVWGGIKTIKDDWNPQQFRDLVGTIGITMSQLIQMLANVCQLIASKYQIDLAVQRMEMDMIRMQMCMELNQHMLDVGQCRGREESCFNALLSCINFGNMNNMMSSLNSVMSQISSTTQQIGNGWQNFANNVPNLYGGGYDYTPIFQVYIKTKSSDVTKNSGSYCSYDGCTSATTGVPCTDCFVTTTRITKTGGRYCNVPAAQIQCGSYKQIITPGETVSLRDLLIASGSDQCNAEYTFYCFYNNDELSRAKAGDVKENRKQDGAEVTLTFVKGSEKNEDKPCCCISISGHCI